jgi:hypothetical protein
MEEGEGCRLRRRGIRGWVEEVRINVSVGFDFGVKPRC